MALLDLEEESQSETEKTYTEKYLENISKFQEELLLNTEIRRKAEEYGDRLNEPFKSHYEPHHLAAAAIHIASRKKNDPRSIKQLAAYIDTGLFCTNKDHRHKQIKEIRKSVKKLTTNLNIELNPVTSGDYLPYFYKILGFTEDEAERVKQMHSKVEGYRTFCGRSKLAVAAAVVNQAGKYFDEVPRYSYQDLEQKIHQDKRTIERSAKVIEELLENEGYIGREKLKQDLRRVQGECEGKISKRKYSRLGNFTEYTIRRRFGSWKKGLTEAGIHVGKNEVLETQVIRDLEELFEEHEKLTSQLYREKGSFSLKTVARKFGSWSAAKAEIEN